MKQRRTGLSLVLGLLCLLMSSLAAAGDYEIIVGKGEALCEACLENLRRQPVVEAICDRQYAKDLGLNQVEWMTLDLVKHMDLLKRMSNLIGGGNESYQGMFEDPRKLQEYAEGGGIRKKLPTIVLRMAEVDIDQDGTRDQLLKYEEGQCRLIFSGFQYFYESALVVLKADRSTVDYMKTDSLVQHQDKGTKYQVGIPTYQLYDAFQYRGQVYFDKWDGGGGSKQPRPDRNTLSVYQVRKEQAKKVCQIRLFPRSEIPQP